MPAPRRPKLPRELFETRSHAWHSLGLGEELTPRLSRKALVGLLGALLILAATLVVYYNRAQLFPGYGPWVRYATVAILVIVGSAATHWLVRGLSPPLYRRLDPATAGTLGFVMRLFAMALVVILALRIAGVDAATLAVGGAFTAIVLGLAAQQTLGGLFAGIVLQSTRPFKVGERVRLVEWRPRRLDRGHPFADFWGACCGRRSRQRGRPRVCWAARPRSNRREGAHDVQINTLPLCNADGQDPPPAPARRSAVSKAEVAGGGHGEPAVEEEAKGRGRASELLPSQQ